MFYVLCVAGAGARVRYGASGAPEWLVAPGRLLPCAYFGYDLGCVAGVCLCLCWWCSLMTESGWLAWLGGGARDA